MRRALATLAAAVAVLATDRADAHFKLLVPADALSTNATGDPQKDAPCGDAAGTPSGKVTKVGAGTRLVVRWAETIVHPGHFRISIAKNQSEFKTPEPVVVDNDCKSVAIEDPPVAPTVADFVEDHETGTSGATYQHEITVPEEPCEDCYLQVTQFMRQHAPGCFYYHCAKIRIVAGYTGAPVVEGADGGAGDDVPAGTDDDEPGSSKKPPSSSASSSAAETTPSSGCNAAGSDALGTLSPFALIGVAVAFSRLRRRVR